MQRPIDRHTALIFTMVLVSAAEGEMTDAELETIGRQVPRGAFGDLGRFEQSIERAATKADVDGAVDRGHRGRHRAPITHRPLQLERDLGIVGPRQAVA